MTADAAALFARWLRRSYVPSPAAVRFLSSFVMESGDETPWPIPGTGGLVDVYAAVRRDVPHRGIEPSRRPCADEMARGPRGVDFITIDGSAPRTPQPLQGISQDRARPPGIAVRCGDRHLAFIPVPPLRSIVLPSVRECAHR